MKSKLSFLSGAVIGAVAMGVAVWVAMPSMMLSVHPSRYDFDQTVATLQQSTANKGWKVSKVYDIQKTLQAAGYKDMTPATIFSICQPDHAYKILREDANKMVLAVMPCRVGVYRGADGKTYISTMNIGLMGRMFGGTIAQVMGAAGAEENAIVAAVTATE